MAIFKQLRDIFLLSLGLNMLERDIDKLYPKMKSLKDHIPIATPAKIFAKIEKFSKPFLKKVNILHLLNIVRISVIS